MKTILGTEIPENTRGVLYICVLYSDRIEVIKEFIFDYAGQTLELYANYPNPESQVAMGSTYEELCEELEDLHQRMQNPLWIEQLHECI